MSTTEEKGNEVTMDAGAKTPEEKSGSHGIVLLFFIAGFVVSLLLGWLVFPELLYCKKEQPIQFDHALHNEVVDEGCASCHFFREDGTFSGVPTLAQCVDCHEDVQGENPEEEKFVSQYVTPGVEVPWLVYSRQPDCVFFSHAAHTTMAGMDCVTCHGNVGESDHLRPYEYNWITGYSRDIWGKNIAGLKKNTWDRMKMDDCAECHAKEVGERGGSIQTKRDGCFVCHK